MPTYTYKCELCDFATDEFISFDNFTKDNESVLNTPCGDCGGEVLRDYSADQPKKKAPERGDIFEWNYEKQRDGTTKVIPNAKRLQKTHTKILPRNKNN